MAINNEFGVGVLDELIVTGKTATHTRAIELASGAGALKRGQLIGKSDAGAFGAVNGTYTNAYGILAEDKADGDTNVIVYVTGHFNANKVVGYVEATHYDDLRVNGIIVEKAIAY